MPHPQRVNRPSPPVPTGSSREKPTFFHRQSFMFNASSGRKELLCTEREREISNILDTGAIPEERESRSRATPTRSRREIRSERRILSFNPFKPVAIRVCCRIKEGAPRFSIPNNTKRVTKRTRLLKEEKKGKKPCYQEPGEKENGIPGWV